VRQRQTGTLARGTLPSGERLGGWARPLVVGMAAAVSLLVHGGIVVGALDWAGRIDPCAISEPSDAVSVELVATDTTDTLKPERAAEPAPAPEATAPAAGSPTSAESSEKAEPLEKREPVEEAEPIPAPDADDPRTRAADRGEPSDVSAVPTVPAAPAPDPPTETVPEPPKATVQGEDAQFKPKEARRVEKKVARPEGGITSKAKAGKGTESARISASTGAMQAYKAAVQARVNGNRPSGGTPGGTSIVAFGLTPSGGLAYIRLARSSGDDVNDRSALSAVRGAAPFPPPPPGATSSQLQFTIPYYFQ